MSPVGCCAADREGVGMGAHIRLETSAPARDAAINIATLTRNASLNIYMKYMLLATMQ
jgi:hypothetical protein